MLKIIETREELDKAKLELPSLDLSEESVLIQSGRMPSYIVQSRSGSTKVELIGYDAQTNHFFANVKIKQVDEDVEELGFVHEAAIKLLL